MRSDYEEKKENRIERLKNSALKTAKDSTAAFEASDRISDQIPFGQPIIIGHHSEPKARRAYEKIENGMKKGVELHKKSKEMERRASSAEDNTAISSDNPDAISELERKLESLIRYQELMKLANKVIKKWSKGNEGTPKLVELLRGIGIENQLLFEMSKPNHYGTFGFERFQLTNNNAMIRNTKKRIDELKWRFSQKSEEREIGNVKVVKNIDENRVQIFFDGKPDQEIRTKLKRNGFRWSPSVGAWQAYLSDRAFDFAVKEFYGLG